MLLHSGLRSSVYSADLLCQMEEENVYLKILVHRVKVCCTTLWSNIEVLFLCPPSTRFSLHADLDSGSIICVLLRQTQHQGCMSLKSLFPERDCSFLLSHLTQGSCQDPFPSGCSVWSVVTLVASWKQARNTTGQKLTTLIFFFYIK